MQAVQNCKKNVGEKITSPSYFIEPARNDVGLLV